MFVCCQWRKLDRSEAIRSMRGFEAFSDPYAEKRVFQSGKFGEKDVFPHRIKLKPVIIAKSSVNFKNLVPKLNFITNKKMWTGHLRSAMRTYS